ncbi:MAG: roadblock/LC7 domain-containing protein, partial [Thermoplasmata archaeon]
MAVVTDSLRNVLESLNTSLKASGSAVVSKNGIMMASRLPPEAREETFGLLAATIFGASEVAYNELGKGIPQKVIVESEHGKLIVANAGPKAVL